MLQKNKLYIINLVGLNYENLLNTLNQHNIKAYDIKRVDYKQLQLKVKRADYKNLTKILNTRKYENKTDSNYGYLKFKNNIITRFALICSFVLGFAALLFLSMFTFNIEINGLETISNEQVLEVLKDNNIRTNKINVINQKKLENDFTSRFENISLISVVKKGTSILITIKEKINILDNYDAIIAPFNLIVNNIIVSQGTANVVSGEIVKKGDIMVLPQEIINNETVAVKPIAKIDVTYWINGYVEFKKEEQVFVKTGKRVINSHYAMFGKKFFITNNPVKFEYFEKVVYNKSVFNNLFLPLTLTRVTYYELKPEIKINDYEANKEKLVSDCKKLAYSQLLENQQVLEETLDIIDTEKTVYIKVYLKLNKILGD